MKTSNEIAISVKNLTKIFKIYKKSSDLFREIVFRRPFHQDYWALKDVSFEIKKGEVVGVIGRNGAGKSTLLKILSGLMDYDSGELNINGKVSAILELGTGFHPDYTGRENIYVASTMMGWKQSQVEKKIEEIIEFSELRSVIDQPFRTYSSGMQARLTFSTAISVEPEIFIVDEALAAGDAAFVEKCILRMGEIIRSGCTVLLVSHNTNLISRFANRAIWIDKGQLILDGMSEKIAKQYELSVYSEVNKAFSETVEEFDRVGDQKIKILDVQIRGSKAGENVFIHGDDLTFWLEMESEIESRSAGVVLMIYREDGVCVWTAGNNYHLNEDYRTVSSGIHFFPGKSILEIKIKKASFNTGNYFVNLGIEPYHDVAAVSDYHDYLPRFRKFSIVRNDHLILNKVFDTPSIWSVSGNVSLSEAVPAKNLLSN